MESTRADVDQGERALTQLERDRVVMLLWFDATHAAAPVAPVASDTLPQVTLGAPTDAAEAEPSAEDTTTEVPPP